MRTTVLLIVSLVIGLAVHFPQATRAGMLQGVGIQSVSSQQTGTTDQRTATNLVNGLGLFGNAHGDSVNGDMWLTTANNPGDYTNAFVVFDLGTMHTLQKMKVYNYNERSGSNNGRGVQVADILTAGDDLVFTKVIAGQTFTKGPATDTVTDFGQIIPLNNVQARYVRINVITNYGGASASDFKVGLSKVLFYDTTVPPTVQAATRNYSSNQVTVVFSEVVNAASALNLANYTIQSGGQPVTIYSAKLDTFGDRVVLTTAPLTAPACTVTVANVLATSDSTSITKTTVDIVPELAVWLKADTGVTADANNLVSVWADQSGNGNDASQSIAALQPTLAPGSMNGHPSIRFVQSGTTSTNALAIADSPTMRINRDISVMMVVQVDSVTGNNELLSRAIVNRAAPVDYYLAKNAPKFYRGNQGSGGAAFGSAGGSANFPAAETHLLTAVAQGTSCTFYLDGVISGTGTLMTGVQDAGVPTYLGWRIDNVQKLNGNIAEVLLFRGALSDADRVMLGDQLGAKYGLSITDINITTQPQNATAVEGHTASFTVVAQASSSSIGYQWQRNNVNIPNATNASYTTPALTQANSGDTYRVLVSIPGTSASKLSDAAVLTVQPDIQKPTMVYAGRCIWNSNQVVVVFSEPVSAASATVAANYGLDQGAQVTAAAMGADANKVVLSVSGLVNGTTYNLTVQNVKDLFNNTLDTVQQAVSLYPHLALWLRADTGVTVDTFGNASNWSDLSGNANDAIAPSQQGPALVANGFNGKPVLRYDGTNAYMAANPSSSLAIVGDMAICAVMQFTDYSDPNGNEICGKTGGTAYNIPAPYDFYAGPSTGRLRFYRGDGGTGGSGVSYQNVTSTDAPTPGAPHVLLANMAGTAATQFLDGAANGSNQITVPIVDGGGALGIGSRMDLKVHAKGDMAELMIFDVALSEADGAALAGKLGAKYSIAIATTVTPTLSTAVTPQGLVLSWPMPTQTFALESTPNLASGPWTTVTSTVATTNGLKSVTVPMSQSAQFFRLHKQ